MVIHRYFDYFGLLVVALNAILISVRDYGILFNYIVYAIQVLMPIVTGEHGSEVRLKFNRTFCIFIGRIIETFFETQLFLVCPSFCKYIVRFIMFWWS